MFTATSREMPIYSATSSRLSKLLRSSKRIPITDTATYNYKTWRRAIKRSKDPQYRLQSGRFSHLPKSTLAMAPYSTSQLLLKGSFKTVTCHNLVKALGRKATKQS